MTLTFPVELIINGDEWTIAPFRFNVHAINTGSYTPSYRDVTVTGVSPLNLPNAQTNGLKTIKLFGKCEQTPNLFDKDKATLNYYINSSGEEQYNASWACSDYIEVKEGCVYNLSGVSSYGTSPRTGFYDENKDFVSARSQSASNFRIPTGVKYMRVSVYRNSIDTATVKQILTLDKYTIVGTPTFNGDVVSGFSASNYLSWQQSATYTNSFEIVFPEFIFDTYTHNEQFFITINNSKFRLRGWKSGGLALVLSDSNGDIFVNTDMVTGLTADVKYATKLTYDNGVYNFYIKGGSYADWTSTWNLTSNTKAYFVGTLRIGQRTDYPNTYFEGSCDLKTFKMTFDGVTTTILGNPIPILCNNGEVGSTVRLPETVRIFGKNLFDQSQLLNATNWSLNSDGYYNGLFSSFNTEFTSGFEIDVPFKEKTVYTFNCRGYVSDEGARARFIFVYTDETSKSLTIDGTSPAEYTLTTPSTKTLAKIRGSYASGASSTLYLKDIQLEEGSSATAFQPYHASPTAVAQDLLSCGDYVDEQNVTTGEITRKIGYKILDGTETWYEYSGSSSTGYMYRLENAQAEPSTFFPLCTHFQGVRSNYAIANMVIGEMKCLSNQFYFCTSQDTLAGFKSWLAAKYTSGKPVIVVFPKETATSESATAQTGIQTVSGLNTLYITQSAIDDLSMEVTYSAGVEVTIEEVQAANVDQQVEVTIGE